MADEGGSVAALLRIEILLRSHQAQEAKDTFAGIDPGRIPASPQQPYIHTMALVALATEDVDLQRSALKKLEALQPVGPEVPAVDSMIEALRASLDE